MKKVFKSLPLGVQRSLIVGTFMIALILAALIGDWNDDFETLVTFIISTIIAIVLLLVCLWIYAGFKDEGK